MRRSYSRFTVSITEDLRERMRRWDTEVNWSEVARKAFERQVEKLEKREKPAK